LSVCGVLTNGILRARSVRRRVPSAKVIIGIGRERLRKMGNSILVGGAVRFRKEDIDKWVEEQKIEPKKEV